MSKLVWGYRQPSSALDTCLQRLRRVVYVCGSTGRLTHTGAGEKPTPGTYLQRFAELLKD